MIRVDITFLSLGTHLAAPRNADLMRGSWLFIEKCVKGLG